MLAHICGSEHGMYNKSSVTKFPLIKKTAKIIKKRKTQKLIYFPVNVASRTHPRYLFHHEQSQIKELKNLNCFFNAPYSHLLNDMNLWKKAKPNNYGTRLFWHDETMCIKEG